MTNITLDIIGDNQLPAVVRILMNDTVKKTYMVPDLTEEAATKLASRLAEFSKDESRFVRGIYHKNVLVGFLNDTEIKGSSIELGWALHPDHYNKGYATAAVKLAIQALFRRGFEEVIAGAFEENPASLRVMEKSGMIPSDKIDEIEYRGVVHRCVYRHITRICLK